MGQGRTAVSLGRSALVEAAEQLGRALDLIATLPGTPALRRTRIKLQVALIAPLLHVKGYNAPETKAAMERARLLMEQAAALGEPAEDPLLLFSVLYGFRAARTVAFNGEGIRALAAQFLALAQKQGTTVPRVIGHRLMGISLMSTGDIAEGRAHCDRAVALYDPAAHRALAMGIGHDARVGILCYRPFALWMLGYPDAAHADADQALKDAREIGHAATLLIALYYAPATYLLCGDYQAATAVINELLALAEEKASVQWKSAGMFVRSWLVALTGTAADAVVAITAKVSAYRSTGATASIPSYLSYLAEAHAQLGQFDDAWRCIGEATAMIKSTGERWWEANIYRRAGDIALMAPGAGCREGASLFRARARGCPSTASKILGAARGNKRGAPPARSRQAGRGPRSFGSGVWMVHRRLQHVRSEAGQGPARRIGCMSVQGYAAAIGAHQTSSVLLRTTKFSVTTQGSEDPETANGHLQVMGVQELKRDC